MSSWPDRNDPVKAPARTLVVDAAILVAAARGRSSGAILAAAQTAALVTTDRAVAEAQSAHRSRTEAAGIAPDARCARRRDDRRSCRRSGGVAAATRGDRAPRRCRKNRNGSIADTHVLALAWSIDADVWTTDRDFAGTGVASWSTPNLICGLAEAAKDEGPGPSL